MAEGPMKHVQVACAVIENDGKVLCAQRSAAMSLPLKWEFPGGKINPGESAEECLRREVLEELGISIGIHRPLTPTTHTYPSFIVTLYPFLCALRQGAITLHEHSAIAWVEPDRLLDLDWALADLPVIAEYRALRKVRQVR
jgi:8-oxo-dGTP diphosphatase